MKRKIELPATMEMRRKVLIQEELTKTEQLICLLANPDTDVAVLEALQEAYNQGYEDARAKWLPIESAPKDGTLIDLLVNGKRMTSMKWNITSPKFPNGYWSIDEEFNWSSAEHLAPTHWMPIPDFETE